MFTPILVFISIYPIYGVLYSRALDGYAASIETPWIRNVWWDKWYSWLLVGGPLGRWNMATILGLWELKSQESITLVSLDPGNELRKHGFNLLLTVFFALILGLFALVSAS